MVSFETAGFCFMTSVSTTFPWSNLRTASAADVERGTLKICVEDVEKLAAWVRSADFNENSPILDHWGSIFSGSLKKRALLSCMCREIRKNVDSSLIALSISLHRARHFGSMDFTECYGLWSTQNPSLWVAGAKLAEPSCRTRNMPEPLVK